MDKLHAILDVINSVLWHDWVLYVVLGTGVLFTFWSGVSQYRALTHGVSALRGRFDRPGDPGAISHFQALSTALSATVGLGNIGGVAIAVAMGGPGAVFWMWVIGFFGMALKSTEVILAMLYRRTDNPEEPQGGTMWVAKEGFARMGFPRFGRFAGGVFCITLIISAITGGNMFQSWNVAEITHGYFPSIPRFAVGLTLAILVGLVILGGIKRIGAVTGMLVPFMCVLYLVGALVVIGLNLDQVPSVFLLILSSAFSPAEASGAFVGGTAGYAFLWGMKRALFSSEAGQGSAPIAHAAARTSEPVREGVVAGLEPFIDTIVVCTLTALVILLSGAWNRAPDASFETIPGMRLAQQLVVDEDGVERILVGSVLERDPEKVAFLNASPARGEDAYRVWPAALVRSVGPALGRWIPVERELPAKDEESERLIGSWTPGSLVFLSGEVDGVGRRIHGTIRLVEDSLLVAWAPIRADAAPVIREPGIYSDFVGAALTGHAFDRVVPGLGMWMVTLVCWLFAVSTIIGWSYYGEQGVIFLAGRRGVIPYRLAYTALVAVATMGFIRTDEQLDQWTALGTGVMLVANIPVMLVFGYQAMRAYKDYIRRLDAGEMEVPSMAPSLVEVVPGREGE